MATVNIRSLRKSFGSTDILRGVSFDILDGEFVALVGPSGCGKSTLLRIVAGLEGVTSGDVVIDGVTVNRMAPRERDIAMVFQNYALYPHMTVAQNMSFSLTLQKIDKAEIARQVDRAASILGLDALKERYPRQLSGGQRQRVAMGRAIVRNPKVFLFDEPLSNLDAKLRVQMRAEIRQLHQRLRTTTIYVTHDQIEALTMADKVVVMNGGHIEQMGAPLELYDNPATLFVAGFIGSPSMNFLTGEISAANGGVFRSDAGIVFPIGPVEPDFDGNKVIVGFRPENIEIDIGGLQVEVVVAEPTGAETHVTGQLGGQQVTLVFKDRLALSSGQHLGIRISPQAIHLFDAAFTRKGFGPASANSSRGPRKMNNPHHGARLTVHSRGRSSGVSRRAGLPPRWPRHSPSPSVRYANGLPGSKRAGALTLSNHASARPGQRTSA